MTDRERWSRLVDRYLTGECSPEELTEFRQLLRDDPSLRDYLAKVQPRWRDADAGAIPRVNVERALASVRHQLELTPVAKRRTRETSRDRWSLARAAALIAGVGLAFWAGRLGLARLAATRVQTVAFATSAGEQHRITLPDGSRVRLAPATQLTYAAAASGPRHLTLVGEAFFEVVHTPGREFTVQAGHAFTMDIGTAFDIRAYPTDSGARVSVTDGRVALTNTGSARRSADSLGAGDVALLSNDGTTRIERGQDLRAYTDWTTGRLVFAHARLSTVATDLGRWYGLHLSIGDSALANEHVTLTLTAEPAEEAVAVLCGVAGASCERRADGSILLAPLRAGHRARANH